MPSASTITRVRVYFGPDHFRDARTDGDTLVVQVVVTVKPQPEPDVELEGAGAVSASR